MPDSDISVLICVSSLTQGDAALCKGHISVSLCACVCVCVRERMMANFSPPFLPFLTTLHLRPTRKTWPGCREPLLGSGSSSTCRLRRRSSESALLPWQHALHRNYTAQVTHTPQVNNAGAAHCDPSIPSGDYSQHTAISHNSMSCGGS